MAIITKGFIFTVDAAFALIVAGAAIGILAYVHFAGPASYQPGSGEAYSAAHTLLQTTMLAAAQGSAYADAAINASLGIQSRWPSFANGGSASGFSSIGPQLPMLLFQYTANSPITSPVSVDSGMATFAAGNVLYAVNASNGNTILEKGISGNVLYPVVYSGGIVYGNSTGYLTAVQPNGIVTWNSLKLPAAPSSPISIGGGYLMFGAANYIVLASPTNGSFIYSGTSGANALTPAYGSGEFVASNYDPGTNSWISGFAVSNGALIRLWQDELGQDGGASSAQIVGNVIVVVDFGVVYILNMGGQTVSQPVYSYGIGGGGTAGYGGNIYSAGNYNITRINISCGCQTGRYQIPAQHLTNTTITITPRMLYTIAGSNTFVAYSLDSNSTPSWNVSLPEGSASAFQDVALAYGNAYVSGGSTLYAFGTCRALPSTSVLQAVASMYLQGQGGCATTLLNSTYTTDNVAIFINGSYAPAHRVASFNGKNSAAYALLFSNASFSFSVSAWFEANKPGPLIDLYNGSANGGIGGGQGHDYAGAWTTGSGNTVSSFEWTLNGQSCSTAANSIVAGRWYNAVVAVSGYSGVTIYLNGNKNTACSLSPAAQPASLLALSLGANPVGTESFGNESMSDIQVYSGVLNASQAQAEYLAGIGTAPSPGNSTTRLIAWYPLGGDTNDYSGLDNIAYPYNVTYAGAPQLVPPSLGASMEVSAASFPLNLNKSVDALYNVSVVVWR